MFNERMDVLGCNFKKCKVLNSVGLGFFLEMVGV